MTKEQYPITLPSPELRAKWRSEAPRNRDAGISREDYLMDRAAEWSANQELEACCEVVSHWYGDWVNGINLPIMLRTARRPKPPSLKEQAFDALNRLTSWNGDTEARAILLNALEQLPDD